MTSLMNITLGLLMFLFLITIHELGHFIGAKLSGIKVNEFSIGMGPTIFNKQGDETLYSLRALPIGGYVMMEGEEGESEDARSYNNARPLNRFMTILAGPMVNLVFAFLIIFTISSFNSSPTTVIGSMTEDSAAAKAGVQVDDKILKVNNKNINLFLEIPNIVASSNGDIKLTVEREGKVIDFDIKAKSESDGSKSIGIYPKESNAIGHSLSYAYNFVIFFMIEIWNGLKGLFTGLLGLDQLSGPVGVIKQVGTVTNLGVTAFLMFTAMISINLGFFNLLPIPALDGSKLLFISIEMIFGKAINKKFEEKITIVGFMLLLGLIIFVTIKDIITIF